MPAWLVDVTGWHWLAFGLVLALIEAIVPGAALMWLGAAAAVVGLILLAAPGISLTFQLLLFAVVAAISVGAWLWWDRRRPSEQPATTALNDRYQAMIGQRGVVAEHDAAGHVRVRLGDGTWSARWQAPPPGGAGEQSVVTVVGVDAGILVIAPADGAATPSTVTGP